MIQLNEVIKTYAVNQENRFNVVNWVNGVIGVYGGNQLQRVNGSDEIDCVGEMNVEVLYMTNGYFSISLLLLSQPSLYFQRPLPAETS